MKQATILLPLLNDFKSVCEPNDTCVILRHTFNMADVRLHMWGSWGADYLEQDTKYLSSKLRGDFLETYAVNSRKAYPEAL